MPPIISKSAKNAVFRAKMGHFWPKNAWGVTELFFFLCQPLKLMKYANFHPYWLVKNYRNVLNYYKISQKFSFGGKNRPEIKKSSNFHSTDFCHHLVLA